LRGGGDKGETEESLGREGKGKESSFCEQKEAKKL
jgi:hypothetical protein